jgi:hypothetical protein
MNYILLNKVTKTIITFDFKNRGLKKWNGREGQHMDIIQNVKNGELRMH